MPRKAKRIQRNINKVTYNEPGELYYNIIALRQNSKNQITTWMDILPEDVKEVIWKQFYKTNVMVQVQSFGQYRGIIRIYIKNHLKGKFYDDMKYSRNNRIHIRSEHKIESDIQPHRNTLSDEIIWYTNNVHDECHKSICRFFGEFNYSINEYQTNKGDYIFNPKIINSIEMLYGICKLTPENWDYIGRYDETSARRFTMIE